MCIIFFMIKTASNQRHFCCILLVRIIYWSILRKEKNSWRRTIVNDMLWFRVFSCVCRTIYPKLHVSGIIYPPPHVCRTILPCPACTYAAPFIHCQKLPNIGFNDNVFGPEYVSNTQPLHSLGLDSPKWATGIVCFLQLKFNHYIVSLPIKLQSIDSIKFLVS